MEEMMRWTTLWVLLVGCAGEGGDTAGDTDTDTSADTDTTPPAGACNGLPDDAPGVPEQAGVDAPPAMTGGTIEDGTYVVTERFDFSGGTCDCTSHIKWEISGGATVINAVLHTDSEPTQTLSGTVSTSDNQLTLAITCPEALDLQFEYTASSSEIVVWNPVQQQLETYTRQ